MDIRCPQCGTLYEVEDDLIGSESATLKCRECQHIFRLGADATPSREDQQRWMVRDPRTGDVLYFESFETLHQWIMERKVDRTWQISRTSETWKTLGEIGEFAPVFQVVDNVTPSQERRAAAESRAQSGTQGRERTDTLKQFQADEPAHREGARQARREEQRNRESSDRQGRGTESSEQRSAEGGQPEVRLDSGMFGSEDSREARAQTGAGAGGGADSDEWSFGDEEPVAGDPLEDGDVGGDFADDRVDYQQEVGGRNWAVIFGVAVVLIGGAVSYVAVFQPQVLEEVRARLVGESEAPDEAITDEDADDTDTEKDSETEKPKERVVRRVRESIDEARSRATDRGRELFATAQTEAASRRVEAIKSAIDRAEKAAEKESRDQRLGFDGTLAAATRALDGGNAGKARELYHRAIDMKSDNSEAITGLGWSLLNLGKPDAAAAQFRRAIHVNPNYGDAYIGLGNAERQMNHPNKALEAYQDYLDRHPNGSSSSIAEYQSKQLKDTLGVE